MSDIRPAFSSVQGAFGLLATVTPPGGPSVETVVVWQPPRSEEHPGGGEYRRAEARRVLAVARDDVPEIPRGTVIEVPERAGAAATAWRVDSMADVDSDHHRVVVLPTELPS